MKKFLDRPMAIVVGCLLTVNVALVLTSCGADSRLTEGLQDADVGTRNTAPADLINMPDGFANVATKCDNGNRIYVVRDASSNPRVGIWGVAGDPTCK